MRAQLVKGGALGVVACHPGEVRRDDRDIALDPRHSIRLQFVMAGQTAITQFGRGITLEPGQVGVYHSDTEYCLNVLEPSRLVTVSLEETAFAAGLTSLRVPVGQSSWPSVMAGRILAMTLRAAAAEIGYLDEEAAEQLLTVIRLLALEVKSVPSANDDTTTSAGLIVLGARELIKQHLASQELNPRWIAEQLYISVRQLHRAFENENFTIAEQILYERVKKCADELTEPKLTHLSVGRIGARWGIFDASKFSRQFKKLTGHTPSEFRRLNSEFPTVDVKTSTVAPGPAGNGNQGM